MRFFAHQGVGWRWAVVVAVAAGLARPLQADSLRSLAVPDALIELGAPEAQPLTRRAEILYPAPGLPAVIQAGEEVVARIRVRRAMTPPPGVQQLHVFADWSAELSSRGIIALPGTSDRLEYPLEVVQLRPEDTGFLYRLRLRVPLFVAPGVYDLEIVGPGFMDSRARAVRVWADAPEKALIVLRTGEDLWSEAESLWLSDPLAVVVPGGVTDARLPLARWPMATFTAPRSDEVTAHRLVSYIRRFGPVDYSVRIGNLILLGALGRGLPLSRPGVSVQVGAGPQGASRIEGPAKLVLRPGPERQGLALAETVPWSGAVAPRVVWRWDEQGGVVELAAPPSGGFELPFLVPNRAGGWEITAVGAEVRVSRVSPGSGDLCGSQQTLLVARVSGYPGGPLQVTIRPGGRSGWFSLAAGPDFGEESRELVLGREVLFEARVEEGGRGARSRAEEAQVVWNFGDGSVAFGSRAQHRFWRGGPARVCVAAFDAKGRTASAQMVLSVQRWSLGGPVLGAGARRVTGGALIALSLLGLLWAWRGNIWSQERR